MLPFPSTTSYDSLNSIETPNPNTFGLRYESLQLAQPPHPVTHTQRKSEESSGGKPALDETTKLSASQDAEGRKAELERMAEERRKQREERLKKERETQENHRQMYSPEPPDPWRHSFPWVP